MKKTAIVTGASRGIGRAAAIALSKNFNVVVNCIKNVELANKTAEEIIKTGGNAIVFCADVSNFDKAHALCGFALEKYGSIDVLVNNAGIAQQKVFCDITEDEFKNMMQTNAGSVFNMCKAAVGEMIRKKSGKIINVSSVWGICGASCEVHYSASKAAVIGLTKALAKELAPSQINVNCVAPGVVDTDMCSFDEETRKLVTEDIPMGKMASPEKIADVIAYLASDKADYITGEVVNVSGGFVV